jgi:hypothetical protein
MLIRGLLAGFLVVAALTRGATRAVIRRRSLPTS